MPNDTIDALLSKLRQMPAAEQRQLAIDLASVVLSLGELSTQGQPAQGLALVAQAVRASHSLAEVDEARHALLAMPEMSENDEPEGLAWFAFGASVAWVYAADASTTSPADGVVHTFQRVSDLLGALDEDLGDTGLHDELLRAVSNLGATAGSLSVLAATVRGAMERLRPQ